MKMIEIRDYIEKSLMERIRTATTPDIFMTDGTHSVCQAIRHALADAKAVGADAIHFERGIYYLADPAPYETDQSAHDAGAKLTDSKEILVLIDGFENFTVFGDTDENGEPATLFAGMNTGEAHSIQPAILWCENCKNLRVENLKFTRTPMFASAGQIERIDGDTIYVRVSDGNPCYDGMPTHCMNRFTDGGRTLYGESLSYGPGLGVSFRLVGERLLSLTCAKVASRVEVGDFISWHQGAKTDFQCYFGRSSDVTLRNLRTVNANGFAMIAFDIHNLTADRVVIKPEGNQLFTAPRDAWKLHKCSGVVKNTHYVVEGVRMDGQNVHNNYLFVKEKTDDTHIIVESDNARSDFRFGLGDNQGVIEFYRDEEYIGKADLSGCTHLSTNTTEKGRNYQTYRLTFAEPLPEAVDTDTLALALCFQPDIYYCADSVFRNVAGAGHLMRTPHIRIERCRYENMMNPGILLGAEFPTFAEGGNCYDVRITDCEFDNCGFTPRYATVGCIGIHSYGFHKAVNYDIAVENCVMKNSAVGIDIQTAKQVAIRNCTYENIGEQVKLG